MPGWFELAVAVSVSVNALEAAQAVPRESEYNVLSLSTLDDHTSTQERIRIFLNWEAALGRDFLAITDGVDKVVVITRRRVATR